MIIFLLLCILLVLIIGFTFTIHYINKFIYIYYYINTKETKSSVKNGDLEKKYTSAFNDIKIV